MVVARLPAVPGAIGERPEPKKVTIHLRMGG
jgi:hypothetical protein